MRPSPQHVAPAREAEPQAQPAAPALTTSADGQQKVPPQRGLSSPLPRCPPECPRAPILQRSSDSDAGPGSSLRSLESSFRVGRSLPPGGRSIRWSGLALGSKPAWFIRCTHKAGAAGVKWGQGPPPAHCARPWAGSSGGALWGSSGKRFAHHSRLRPRREPLDFQTADCDDNAAGYEARRPRHRRPACVCFSPAVRATPVRSDRVRATAPRSDAGQEERLFVSRPT